MSHHAAPAPQFAGVQPDVLAPSRAPEPAPARVAVFEIVNPSDECTIEGADFKALAGACVLLSEGKYALREIDGSREVPLFLFSSMARIDGWFRANCGGSLDEVLTQKRTLIAEALATVALGRPGHRDVRRSSLNDICGRAHELAEALRKRK